MEGVKSKKLSFKGSKSKTTKKEQTKPKKNEDNKKTTIQDKEIQQLMEGKLTAAQIEQKRTLQEHKNDEEKKGNQKSYQERRKEYNDKLTKQTDINDLFRTNCSWLERVEHM